MASHAAADLAALSRAVGRIPDTATKELVRWFVPRSKKVGGRMRWFGKRVQLSSRQVRRRAGRTDTRVTIRGTPAACWSIKSYGRRGGYDVTPRRAAALRLSQVAPGVIVERVRIEQPATGDRRWDRLVADAGRKFPDVVSDLLARTVRD